MAACLAGLEEITITLPGIVIIANRVGIIVPFKSYQERFHMDTFTLFSIASCLLSLADQAGIHFLHFSPFVGLFIRQKGTRQQTRASVNNC